MSGTALLIVSGGAVLLIFLLVNLYGTNYSLDKIKDKTVGHGQQDKRMKDNLTLKGLSVNFFTFLKSYEDIFQDY